MFGLLMQGFITGHNMILLKHLKSLELKPYKTLIVDA